MRAFKFLGVGAVGLFSGFRWPTGSTGDAGPWVETAGPLEECGNGIHACRIGDLPYWIDDELWEIELAGEVLVERHGLIARRGRLVGRLGNWGPVTAGAFAEACAGRARSLADTAGALAVRAELYAADVATYAADAKADVAWASCAAYAEAYLAGFVASGGDASRPVHRAAFETARRRQAHWLAGEVGLRL